MSYKVKISIYGSFDIIYIFTWQDNFDLINSDSNFAKLIHMSREDYQKIMIENFNAKIHEIGELYFENYKDAKKAKEWYESQLVLYTLLGDGNV